MSPLETKVRALFDAYGKHADDALRDPPVEDIDGFVASFAAYFVGSSPKGVMGGANDDQLRKVIPQGYAHYRAVGGKHMTIKGGRSGHVTFTNFYFVTIADGRPKIFGYVTPDEEQAMQEHGLV